MQIRHSNTSNTQSNPMKLTNFTSNFLIIGLIYTAEITIRLVMQQIYTCISPQRISSRILFVKYSGHSVTASYKRTILHGISNLGVQSFVDACLQTATQAFLLCQTRVCEQSSMNFYHFNLCLCLAELQTQQLTLNSRLPFLQFTHGIELPLRKARLNHSGLGRIRLIPRYSNFPASNIFRIKKSEITPK